MQLILPIASLVRNRCDRSYLLHRHKLLSHPIPSQCNNDHLFHQICKIDAIVATYCIRFVFDSRRSDAIGLKISRDSSDICKNIGGLEWSGACLGSNNRLVIVRRHSLGEHLLFRHVLSKSFHLLDPSTKHHLWDLSTNTVFWFVFNIMSFTSTCCASSVPRWDATMQVHEDKEW